HIPHRFIIIHDQHNIRHGKFPLYRQLFFSYYSKSATVLSGTAVNWNLSNSRKHLGSPCGGAVTA
ncbi:MAG: hypothetical protein MSS94_02335, partial [Clostridiales bacterium]|nr:hypothetical protein [Clostridiales bacterium]